MRHLTYEHSLDAMTILILTLPIVFLLGSCETDFQRCFEAEASKMQVDLPASAPATNWIKQAQTLSKPEYDPVYLFGVDNIWLAQISSVRSYSPLASHLNPDILKLC